MTILQKLKQKSQQALQGVGNFIDRDQDMGGVQLAKGGLGNQISGLVNRGANALGNEFQAQQQTKKDLETIETSIKNV